MILSQVKHSPRIYRYTEWDRNHERERLARNPDDEPQVDFNDHEVINEQVRLLKVLCARRVVADTEFAKLVGAEIGAQNAAVVAHTLVELRQLPELLTVLSERRGHRIPAPGDSLAKLQDRVYGPAVHVDCLVWMALREKLEREPHWFTDGDLDAIDGACSMEERLFTLLQQKRVIDAAEF